MASRMTLNPAFPSRDCIEIPDNFGRRSNIRCVPAPRLDEAMRPSRAINHHLQAFGVYRLLRRGRYSVTNLEKRCESNRKSCHRGPAGGRAPATERDFILWS